MIQPNGLGPGSFDFDTSEDKEKEIMSNSNTTNMTMTSPVLQSRSLTGSKKDDPFSISGDEDFSPKVYKPILRRIGSYRDNRRPRDGDLKRPSSPIPITTPISNSENHNFDDQTADVEERLTESAETSSSPEKKKLKTSPCVVYIYDEEMVKKTNKLARIKGRVRTL